MLAFCTLGLRLVLSEQSIENYYSRGLYPFIRKILDTIHRILPIHFLVVLVILLLVWLGVKTLKVIKRKDPWRKALINIGANTLGFLAMVFTLFMWLWGFNYGRVDIYEQLGIKGEAISKERIKAIAEQQTQLIIDLRQQSVALPDSGSTSAYQLPEELSDIIFKATDQTFDELALGNPGSPQAKMLKPKGVLLCLSTAGFYSPWTGEPNVDAGLHPLQIPFVMAHELSHGMGITDEGGCNFMAVLIGRKLQNPMLRYAFELSYWRYVMGSYRRQDESAFEDLRNQLPANISNDLLQIKINGNKYPDLFPTLRNLFYDNYLKSQGVKAGMKSYGQVVNMIEAWEKKNAK